MKTAEAPSMVRKIVLSLLLILIFPSGYKAQRHEIGVQLGISNLVGDIGRTNYVLQKPILDNLADYGLPFYGGILYRMNFNPYQTLRFNVGYSHIQFVDAVAKEDYRRQRGFWGTNSAIEADAIFEYNFFPVNDEQRSMISPYVFGGIGAMIVNTPQVVLDHDFRRDAGGTAIAPTSEQDFVSTPDYISSNKMTFAVPFGVGLKYKFNYNWALFGEFMFRPTFSDSIDYSMIDDKNMKQTYNKDFASTANPNQSLLQEEPYINVANERAQQYLESRQLGNIHSKDWVNSMTIGLSYSFGRPPCYCD